MNKEDEALIKELGFDKLTKEWQARELANFYKTLHMRLNFVLEDMLTDEQLIAFGEISKKGNDAAIQAWFEKAVPNYDEIVSEQTELLKEEIKQTAERTDTLIDKSE